MAPVSFGLDLGQMSWGAFSSKNMFGNRDWHLRRSKLAVYQCALIFCVVSESLGTDVLSDYIDQQRYLKSVSGGRAYEYNNDYVGVASYNIFAGVYVAFIFGAAFFFDLFFPGRHEAKSIRLAWKICGCLAVIFHLADALALTIITATKSAYVTGQPQYVTQQNLADFHKDGGMPLTYRKDGRAVAAVVFVWLGWVSVFASNMLLFFSIHNTEYGKGPKTAHTEGRGAAHLYANTPVAERHRLQDPEAQFMAKDEKPEINGAVPGNVDGTAGTNATSNTGTAAEIPTQQANNAHTNYHISNPDEERAV